jgi:hypothetical protein
LLLLVVLTGCVFSTPPVGAQQRTAPVSVTVSVFSGRKDPEFSLTVATEQDQLRTLLRAAAPHRLAQAPVIKSVLGYRGIIVKNPAGVIGIPPYIAVHKGVIEVRAEKVSFFVDQDRKLERLLLDQARAANAIDAKLYAKIVAAW